jgi:hypothetical protein
MVDREKRGECGEVSPVLSQLRGISVRWREILSPSPCLSPPSLIMYKLPLFNARVHEVYICSLKKIAFLFVFFVTVDIHPVRILEFVTILSIL